MLDRKNFYIDGKWVSPAEPKNFKVIDPSNEEICAADLNSDGIINILDIVTLVNVIISSDV